MAAFYILRATLLAILALQLPDPDGVRLLDPLPAGGRQFLVGLWMMPMLVEFKQTAATGDRRTDHPDPGRFLAAHSLAPEYRSGIGAVLACKPNPLGRVVALGSRWR